MKLRKYRSHIIHSVLCEDVVQVLLLLAPQAVLAVVIAALGQVKRG